MKKTLDSSSNPVPQVFQQTHLLFISVLLMKTLFKSIYKKKVAHETNEESEKSQILKCLSLNEYSKLGPEHFLHKSLKFLIELSNIKVFESEIERNWLQKDLLQILQDLLNVEKNNQSSFGEALEPHTLNPSVSDLVKFSSIMLVFLAREWNYVGLLDEFVQLKNEKELCDSAELDETSQQLQRTYSATQLPFSDSLLECINLSIECLLLVSLDIENSSYIIDQSCEGRIFFEALALPHKFIRYNSLCLIHKMLNFMVCSCETMFLKVQSALLSSPQSIRNLMVLLEDSQLEDFIKHECVNVLRLLATKSEDIINVITFQGVPELLLDMVVYEVANPSNECDVSYQTYDVLRCLSSYFSSSKFQNYFFQTGLINQILALYVRLITGKRVAKSSSLPNGHACEIDYSYHNDGCDYDDHDCGEESNEDKDKTLLSGFPRTPPKGQLLVLEILIRYLRGNDSDDEKATNEEKVSQLLERRERLCLSGYLFNIIQVGIRRSLKSSSSLQQNDENQIYFALTLHNSLTLAILCYFCNEISEEKIIGQIHARKGKSLCFSSSGQTELENLTNNLTALILNPSYPLNERLKIDFVLQAILSATSPIFKAKLLSVESPILEKESSHPVSVEIGKKIDYVFCDLLYQTLDITVNLENISPMRNMGPDFSIDSLHERLWFSSRILISIIYNSESLKATLYNQVINSVSGNSQETIFELLAKACCGLIDSIMNPGPAEKQPLLVSDLGAYEKNSSVLENAIDKSLDELYCNKILTNVNNILSSLFSLLLMVNIWLTDNPSAVSKWLLRLQTTDQLLGLLRFMERNGSEYPSNQALWMSSIEVMILALIIIMLSEILERDYFFNQAAEKRYSKRDVMHDPVSVKKEFQSAYVLLLNSILVKGYSIENLLIRLDRLSESEVFKLSCNQRFLTRDHMEVVRVYKICNFLEPVKDSESHYFGLFPFFFTQDLLKAKNKLQKWILIRSTERYHGNNLVTIPSSVSEVPQISSVQITNDLKYADDSSSSDETISNNLVVKKLIWQRNFYRRKYMQYKWEQESKSVVKSISPASESFRKSNSLLETDHNHVTYVSDPLFLTLLELLAFLGEQFEGVSSFFKSIDVNFREMCHSDVYIKNRKSELEDLKFRLQKFLSENEPTDCNIASKKSH